RISSSTPRSARAGRSSSPGWTTTARSTPTNRRSTCNKRGGRARDLEGLGRKAVRNKFAAVAFGLAMASAALSPAGADPIDEKLVIDGVEIVSRAKAPEGLPFDEVLSGWLYREAETRALEEDSFE